MPYQSIFAGGTPNVLGGKPNPFAAGFKPGQYAAVNAQNAYHGVPAPGDKSNLVLALNKLNSYNGDDQVRILNRAAQAGLVDRNKAADVIKNSSSFAPTAPPKLNLWQKGAVIAHEAVPAVAHGIYQQAQNAAQGIAAFTGGNAILKQQQDTSTKLDQAVSQAKAKFATGQISKDQYTQTLKQVSQLQQDLGKGAKQIGRAADARKTGLGLLNTASLVAGPSEIAGLKDVGVAGKALSSAAVGGGYGALSGLSEDKVSAKDVLKQAGIGAALGATGSILASGVSKATDRVKATPLPQAKTPPPLSDSTSVGEVAGKSAGKGTMGADIAPVEGSFALNKTPDYTKQVEETLNKVKPVGASGTATGAVKELQGLLTPGAGTKAVQTDLRAATGNLALKTNKERQAAKDSVKLFASKQPGENLNFIQKVESGVKQDTPELQQAADTFRKGFDQDYELAKSIKPDTPYLDNYFAQSGIWSDPKEADAFAKRFQNPTLGGKPGALEQRTFPTIYDGVKAGLKLKETNPGIIALNNRTSLLKAKMAQDFLEEQTAKGVDPDIAQRVVDRYLQPGLQSSDVYKTAKGAAYALNSLQLALSGFHVTGTALNATFSEFANGLNDILRLHPAKGATEVVGSTVAPLKYILSGNKILKDLKAGNITQDISNIAEGGGRIGKQVDYQATGLSKSLQEIKQGGTSALKGVAAAPFRAINDASKPVMEWWVPRIKAGATKSLIDRKLAQLGPNASPEAIRAAKATAIDSIDNRFGQLVQDNLFWNKKVKDISQVLMRSPGWNIGTVREVGGGTTSLLKPSTLKGLATGKGLPESTAYSLSLAAGTALIGTALSYLYTGKGPKNPIDYFYPKTGQVDKNGNDERVSLPTYAKDIFAFTHNPTQTISNKANPLISLGKEAATNKDYFGNQIRNPDDSAGTQAKQTLGFAAKNVLPFSVTNANQRVKKDTSTKIQSFAGLTPAPGYITKSGFQQKVQSALTNALGSKPLTPEEAALVTAKSNAKTANKGGDASKIDALVKSGQITDQQAANLKTSSTQTSLANQFQYLLKVDKPAAAKLIKQAGPDDIKKLGDLQGALQTLATSSQDKTSSQKNRTASTQLLQALNKNGYNVDELINQKKQATKEKAKQTRLSKIYGR